LPSDLQASGEARRIWVPTRSLPSDLQGDGWSYSRHCSASDCGCVCLGLYVGFRWKSPSPHEAKRGCRAYNSGDAASFLADFGSHRQDLGAFDASRGVATHVRGSPPV